MTAVVGSSREDGNGKDKYQHQASVYLHKEYPASKKKACDINNSRPATQTLPCLASRLEFRHDPANGRVALSRAALLAASHSRGCHYWIA